MTTRVQERDCIAVINKWGQTQINYKPNKNNAFLDLVLTNDTTNTSIIDCLPADQLDTNSNHHNSLTIQINTNTTSAINKINKIINFSKIKLKHY